MISKSTGIKDNLHKMVSEIKDEVILGKVNAYINTLQSKNIDWWELTTVQEKEMIYESQQQLKAGKGIPHNEVRQKVDILLRRI